MFAKRSLNELCAAKAKRCAFPQPPFVAWWSKLSTFSSKSNSGGMIASTSMWWGGWAFGPRHLSTLAVLILAGGLPLVPHAAWARWTFAALCAVGLLINLAAKGTTGYSLPTQVMHPFTEMIWPGVVAKSFTDMQWTNALGFSGVMGMAMFLLGLFASLRFMAATSPTETPR